jgi:hypothetical protein
MNRVEKLKVVREAIKFHQSVFKVFDFGSAELGRARYELYTLGAGDAPPYWNGIEAPLTMREGPVRQALHSNMIHTHEISEHDQTKHPVGIDGAPLIERAEARLFRTDGSAVKGANGKVTILCTGFTERHPGGVIDYRVLGKYSTGTISASRIKLVKPTDASRRDVTKISGIPPSNRGYKKGKKQ